MLQSVQSPSALAAKPDDFYSDLFSRLQVFSPDVFLLFDLARVLDTDELELSNKLHPLLGTSDDHDIPPSSKNDVIDTEKSYQGDWELDSMHSMRELPKLLKKQFMLPDEIFDRRLLFKELIVQREVPEYKRVSMQEHLKQQNALTNKQKIKRQCTYILMDISGSMKESCRLHVAKAIILRYLYNNQKGEGEVYFRHFNHDLGPLHFANSRDKFTELINQGVLSAIPRGGTNLQTALEQTLKDLNEISLSQETEVLIVTDGLCEIDPDHFADAGKRLVCHAVKIGSDELSYTDAEWADHYCAQYAPAKTGIDGQWKSNRDIFNALTAKTRNDFRVKYKDTLSHQLETLIGNCNGKYIAIDDVPEDYLNPKQLIEQVAKELNRVNNRLKNEPLTELEYVKILEVLCALQNFLNYLKDNNKLNADDLSALGELQEKARATVEDNADLSHLVKISQGHSGSLENQQDLKHMSVDFKKLFSLLFLKMKSLVFSRGH